MPVDTSATSNLITLEGDDGSTHECRLLEIFSFDGSEYALLLRQGPAEELVMMRYLQRDDQSVFQVIDREDEFERVVAYLTFLADINDEE